MESHVALVKWTKVEAWTWPSSMRRRIRQRASSFPWRGLKDQMNHAAGAIYRILYGEMMAPSNLKYRA